jgi:Leucine-rich repeat (LRR) protein
MGLQSVPFSLFTIGKENYSCRLLLQHNQIEDISFNSSLFISENADSVFTNKFETINLSSNKLRMIPGFLSGLKIGTLDLSENPVETIPLDIAGYKVDSLSLSSTLITEIPVELFHATFQISISNRVSSINLPPVEQVPEYTGQKFINNYSEDEDFKKQYEAISKKMITVPYEN